MPETLLYHSEIDPPGPWVDALRAELPWLNVRVSHEPGDDRDVRYALAWNPPAGFFARFPNLEFVTNLGAGVDGLLARGDLPAIPIARISDPNMSRMMASFVLFAVLRHARDIVTFERAQRRAEWRFVSPRPADEIRVGVLGLGQLGALAAQEVARQGFRVSGWSRTPKALSGISCHSGMEALPDFLSACDILVVMVPLTRETRHLLNAERLAALPRGAKLVNVARGPIIDEPALVDALRSGHIGEATLDVFEKEPLPADRPLWAMENVLITPHLASMPIPRTAAAQVAANIRRIRAGEPIENRVDLLRGY